MRFKRILCIIFIFVAVLIPWNSVSASASSAMMIDTVAGESVAVSPALDVIAHENSMAIAGIRGNTLGFSAERFACALNLSDIDYITVTKLPDATCGVLYIGSEGVSQGQRLTKSDIGLMTYEESAESAGRRASFDFTVNGSAYSISCNIFMLDSLNYSPTLSLAAYASLNLETYRDVSAAGTLSAFDPEGDDMIFEVVRYPEAGDLNIIDRELGTYVYTPDPSFTGEDSFLYVARDKYGNYSASAKVSISVLAPSTSTVYSDIEGDEIYRHAIAMTECGLMNGVQVGAYYYFEEDREVSRIDFLVTAMNAIGIRSVPDAEQTVFSDDASIPSEMKGYVALAHSKGYISGKESDGELCFMPDETISISEAAVIIGNMIGYADPHGGAVVVNAGELPSWSQRAIESLHALGILELPDKTIDAYATVTRGDMAKLLNKTMIALGK